MAAGRKPDYSVSALNPKTNLKGKVGAAWTNDDGSLQLKLDPFVVLKGEDDLLIRLFPTEKVPGAAAKPQQSSMDLKPGATPRRGDLDDEIPF